MSKYILLSEEKIMENLINYITINNRQDIENFINKLPQHPPIDKIDFKIEYEKYTPEIKTDIQYLLSHLPPKTSASILIENEHSQIKVKDLEYFVDIEEEAAKNNHTLFFVDGLQYYTLTDTINAEEQIEKFTNKIKETNGSPLEKYLMIYNFLIKRLYKENEKDKWTSRSIIGSLSSDYIVCVGYANIMQRLCKEVGITCHTQSFDIYDKNNIFTGSHENNVVELKDDKYGINGMFYCDACFDSTKKENDDGTYVFCLMPLEDYNKINDNERLVPQGYNDFAFYYTPDKFPNIECYSNWDRLKKITNSAEISRKEKAEIKELYNDPERCLRACGRFKKLFLEYKIPADVYNHKSEHPNMCNYDYIFALLMEDEIDTARLQASIRVLKDFEKKAGSFKAPRNIKTDYKIVKDIYSYIESIEKEVMNQYSTHQNKPIYKHKKDQDTKHLHLPFGLKKYIQLTNENQSYKFQGSKPLRPFALFQSEIYFTKIIEGRKTQEIIKTQLEQQPIPYETFRKALINSFILSGDSEKEATDKTKEILRVAKYVTGNCFMPGAKSCFYTEYHKDDENTALENT